MATRIEGQIWLGTDAPHILKYYAGSTEYWTVSASTYIATAAVHKGMIVAIDGTTTDAVERVRPAIWPTDADNIAGICISEPESTIVRVVNYGYLSFSSLAELQDAFVTHSDLDVQAALTGSNYYSAFGNTTTDGGAGNGWTDSSSFNGKGKPIYWFTGRTLKTGASTYSWEDADSYKGKLTFATPSGYKLTGTEIPWADDELDIGYRDLPIIGSVVSYSYSGTELTGLTLHVNFSKLSHKFRFTYPASASLKQYQAVNNPEELNLRHGLFSDLKDPLIDVKMWGQADSDPDVASDGESQTVYPGFDSYLSTGDRRTEVEIASNSDFYYKVLGEVCFNF